MLHGGQASLGQYAVGVLHQYGQFSVDREAVSYVDEITANGIYIIRNVANTGRTMHRTSTMVQLLSHSIC